MARISDQPASVKLATTSKDGISTPLDEGGHEAHVEDATTEQQKQVGDELGASMAPTSHDESGPVTPEKEHNAVLDDTLDSPEGAEEAKT